MNIPYHDTATILGLQIKNTVGESALASWMKTTAKRRTQAQEAYCRMLALDKRIQFVHEYLMAQCMVCVSNLPPAWRMCASTEYDDLLVCMEGRHISCASANPISVKGRRRLGLNELACRKSCIALISNATASVEARNNNVGMVTDVGPKC
jgi:hypothetical protein